MASNLTLSWMLNNKTASYKTIKMLCRFQDLPLSNFWSGCESLVYKREESICERALATFSPSFYNVSLAWMLFQRHIVGKAMAFVKEAHSFSGIYKLTLILYFSTWPVFAEQYIPIVLIFEIFPCPFKGLHQSQFWDLSSKCLLSTMLTTAPHS